MYQERGKLHSHQVISEAYSERIGVGAHLSVQSVSYCGNDACMWVDGKQVLSIHETVLDLDM